MAPTSLKRKYAGVSMSMQRKTKDRYEIEESFKPLDIDAHLQDSHLLVCTPVLSPATLDEADLCNSRALQKRHSGTSQANSERQVASTFFSLGSLVPGETSCHFERTDSNGKELKPPTNN